MIIGWQETTPKSIRSMIPRTLITMCIHINIRVIKSLSVGIFIINLKNIALYQLVSLPHCFIGNVRMSSQDDSGETMLSKIHAIMCIQNLTQLVQIKSEKELLDGKRKDWL